MKRVLLCLLIFLVGCGSSKTTLGPYSIGRDPSWFPLRLGQMAPNINGFANSLVQQLARVEKKNFTIVDVGWNQLFDGLEKGDYAGVFSSLPPNMITTEKYDFSNPFLLLGPVLVVPIHSKATSLDDLAGSTVGAYQYDDSVLIVQKHPSIVISLYESIPKGLEDVVKGNVEGALIPNLEAKALIENLYPKTLKIVSPPLNDKGLRLLTLKGEHQDLIKDFNEGLEKLKEESNYRYLRKKFKVI